MKDIYELLNDIDMDDFEEASSSKFEKDKIKHSLKNELFSKKHKLNRKTKFLAAASILFFIASSTFLLSNPTYASDIPLINKLLQKLYENKNIDFIPYSDFIGQTVQKDNIELTFNNVVISNDSMFLDFTIKNNENNITKGEFNDAIMMPQKITINDIDLPTSGRTSSEMLDEHTIRILETIDINSIEYIPEGNLNVEINIYEVFNLKDTFDFKFKYDKTAQDKKSISKTYDTEINLADKKIILNKAYASPLSCSISFASDCPNNANLGFIAIDNNGELLNFNKSSGTLDSQYTNSIFYISNKDMKQVTFIPYIKINGNFDTDIKSTNKKDLLIELESNKSIKLFKDKSITLDLPE